MKWTIALPIPRMTIGMVLSWADAHKKRFGVWPKRDSGPVHAGPLGLTWLQVDGALYHGTAGLDEGGSSLSRLLAKHRGYRNVRALPRLTEERIALWADDHIHRFHTWPNENSGRVWNGPPGETWDNVNSSLRKGHRGLPGGDSLAALLARCRNLRTRAAIPRLTIKAILQWADKHHKSHGAWPKAASGAIAGLNGETWLKVDQALKHGTRGLRGGSSVPRLLKSWRGVRNSRNPPRLTRRRILAWADRHHERTGKWPNTGSGPVVGAAGETWKAVNRALREGLRGLPGRDLLSALLQRRRHIGGPRLAGA